jgi:hypothetical protein
MVFSNNLLMGAAGQGGTPFSISNTANGTPSVNTGTTHTFSSLAFGDADATRIIIIATSNSTNNNNGRYSSVTIGGVTATQIVTALANSADDGLSGIFAAKVPSGTSGNVVITLTAGIGGNRAVSCSVFAMYGKDSVSAHATNNDSATNGLLSTLSLNVPAGGAVIGTTGHIATSSVTCTWVGATRINNQQPGIRQKLSEAFSADLSAGTPRTVTATWSGANGVTSGAAASYGP